MAPAEVGSAAARAPRVGDGRGVRWFRRALGLAGTAGLTIYLGWNFFWLAQRRLPPSLFRAATGWPCPTTGGTRSLAALLDGDWSLSLRLNAMTVPILALLVLSLGWLAAQAVRRRRLRLPQALFWAWLSVLALAWVLKLAGGSQYW